MALLYMYHPVSYKRAYFFLLTNNLQPLANPSRCCQDLKLKAIWREKHSDRQMET